MHPGVLDRHRTGELEVLVEDSAAVYLAEGPLDSNDLGSAAPALDLLGHGAGR